MANLAAIAEDLADRDAGMNDGARAERSGTLRDALAQLRAPIFSMKPLMEPLGVEALLPDVAQTSAAIQTLNLGAAAKFTMDMARGSLTQFAGDWANSPAARIASAMASSSIPQLLENSAFYSALKLSSSLSDPHNGFLNAAALIAGADLTSLSSVYQNAARDVQLTSQLANALTASAFPATQIALLDGSLTAVLENSWIGGIPHDYPEGEDLSAESTPKDEAGDQLVVVGGWITRELIRRFEEEPSRMASLSPGQFEELVGELLEEQGFRISRTGNVNSPDGGLDFIAVRKKATWDSLAIGVQVKHHRGNANTGPGAVRSLLSWQTRCGVGLGLLVTNTLFTREAEFEARRASAEGFIRLRDQTDLARWCAGEFDSPRERRELPERIQLTSSKDVEVPGGSSLKIWLPGDSGF